MHVYSIYIYIYILLPIRTSPADPDVLSSVLFCFLVFVISLSILHPCLQCIFTLYSSPSPSVPPRSILPAGPVATPLFKDFGKGGSGGAYVLSPEQVAQAGIDAIENDSEGQVNEHR
jgi:hypothetical protein